MSKELWQLAGLLLACSNAAAFLLMGADKRRAQRGQYRIPEKALFLFPVLFGALGGLLGMRAFRHKTRHWYFRWGFSALLAIQSVLLALLVWRASSV